MKKIAFIGCAHIHTPAFVEKVKARNNVQVAAVWDHDKNRAAKNAAALNSCVVDDYHAILADPEISSIVICSETNLHRELVLAAAEAGKNMFVEKPLSANAAEAQELADAVEKAGVVFQTGYFMRGNPVNIFLKQQIEAGAFGKITRVRHSNCHSGSLGGWFDTDWRWMAAPDIAGCGAYGDLGTHSLDIVMWFLGNPKKAFSTIFPLTNRYGENCDEYGEGNLVFENNVIATIAAGWVDCANPVVCEICGTEGHAVYMNDQLFFQSSKVEGADGLTPWTNLPDAMPHAFDLYLDKVLDNKDVPLVSVREAAARNIVMAALYKANNTERQTSTGF